GRLRAKVTRGQRRHSAATRGYRESSHAPVGRETSWKAYDWTSISRPIEEPAALVQRRGGTAARKLGVILTPIQAIRFPRTSTSPSRRLLATTSSHCLFWA